MDEQSSGSVPGEYYWHIGRKSKFDELEAHDPIIAGIRDAGGTAEDCAVALSELNRDLSKRLMDLQAIAPFKIRLPDGRMATWQCPDDLIPIRD